MTQVFNPTILNSYDSLKNFFDSSDAVDRVLSRRETPITKLIAPVSPNLDGIWWVCQIATAPFRFILEIFFSAIGEIASCLGIKCISKPLKNAARYMEAGFNIYSDDPTKTYFLQKMENHSNDDGIVSDTPPIPISQIHDPKVRNRTYHLVQDEIFFNHKGGICRGISNWFVHLYLKTKDQFSDPRQHMIALGKLFSKGGEPEAVLLQSLNIKNGKLLDIRIGVQESRSPGFSGDPLYKKTLFSFKHNQETAIEDMENLPAGVYKLHTPFHAMAYIKINNQLSFVIDPSQGILEINGDNVPEALYSIIRNKAEGATRAAIKTGRFTECYKRDLPSELHHLVTDASHEELEALTNIMKLDFLDIAFLPIELR